MRKSPSVPVCALLLILAACGDDGSDGTASDTGSDTTERDDTGAPDVATDADAGASDTIERDSSTDAAPDASTDTLTDTSTDTLTDTADTSSVVDNDEDGVPAELDCDDEDVDRGASALDSDCDGTLAEVDCDDADPSNSASNVDADGDGFSGCEGDCCDNAEVCSNPPLVNPLAIEVPTSGDDVPTDEDCDGEVDEVATPCDVGLDVTIGDNDPLNAAAALGLCGTTDESGLVAARWVRANGAERTPSTQNGLLSRFGDVVVPQSGERMVALSSGAARDRDDPNACTTLSCDGTGMGTPPPGWPLDDSECQSSSGIYDDAGLELQLRVPTNATGFTVDLRYFTNDYPTYVCTAFTDVFAVLMTPAPEGSISGNIAFDASNRPLSANFRILELCSGCASGTDALAGTGFDQPDSGAGTLWKRVSAPATPGSTLTLRFVIWDSSDQTLDSTALIDNFAWTFGATPALQTVVAR